MPPRTRWASKHGNPAPGQHCYIHPDRRPSYRARKIGRILSSLALHYGLCCLLVEHDLDFVQEIATRIVVLHQGLIVMQGSFEEVVHSDLVKTIYAGSAHAAPEAA